VSYNTWNIYDARLLQPKQSRVRVHRPNQIDESLACYMTDSVSVSCSKVKVVDGRLLIGKTTDSTAQYANV